MFFQFCILAWVPEHLVTCWYCIIMADGVNRMVSQTGGNDPGIRGSFLAVDLFILYIKMKWFFVCLYVCMELIQIHISERIWTKLCTRLPLGLEKTVGYVLTRIFWPLRPFGPFFFRGQCRIMGTRWLPARPFSRDTLISVVPAGVRVTSPTLRCRWRRSHPRQPYIRDSSGSSPNVADITSLQATESSATASYPLFWWVFASRHGYYFQPGGGAIHHSVISRNLAPVFVVYRKSRLCRRQLRVRTPSVLQSP